jgi:hypothetical protein
MKIQNYLIAVLLFALLPGCNSKKRETVKSINQVISEPTKNENWDDEFQGIFIYHFMTDQNFQKERTDSSIKGMDYVNYFAEKDYTLHIFPSSNSSFDNDLIDGIDNQNVLTVINEKEIRTFTFLKRNKKWGLTKLEILNFQPDSLNGFLNFLYGFSKDTFFRNSHIKFPLKFTYADAEKDYSDTTEFLRINNLSDFNFDFFKDKYFHFFHNNMDNVDRSKYVCLLVRGIDNGIFLWYYFEKKEDTWQLIEENDSST